MGLSKEQRVLSIGVEKVFIKVGAENAVASYFSALSCNPVQFSEGIKQSH